MCLHRLLGDHEPGCDLRVRQALGDQPEHLRLARGERAERGRGPPEKQRRFVADASHELRSPLAAIRTTLEVALAHPDRAPWPVIAERAAHQSVRLEDLIQQLLLLAKADEQQLSTQQQPVDLGALLRDVAASTPAHHLNIDLDVAPGATIAGNPDHLRRLFSNILDNAVRYARRSVLITATTTGDDVRIEIDDDGPGIPATDRERVFDRFVRLDSSRERSSGTTGLGLAIAREVALAHGGSIAIADSVMGGARMIITLPLATSGAPRIEHSHESSNFGDPPKQTP